MRIRTEKRIVAMRVDGATYREIEEAVGVGNGNGTFAFRVCRKWGIAGADR